MKTFVAFALMLVAAQSGAAETLHRPVPVKPSGDSYSVLPDADADPPISQSFIRGGYSVGNFGIAASISDDGLKIQRSLINLPVLGEWLDSFGTGELSLSAGGANDFALAARYSVFPENHSQLLSKTTGVEARIETFSPISSARNGDASFEGFIPAIIVRVELTNKSANAQSIDLSYSFTPEKNASSIASDPLKFEGKDIPEIHQKTADSQTWLMAVPDGNGTGITWQQASLHQPTGTLRLAVSVHIGTRQSRSLSFVFGAHDSRGYTSARLASRQALQKYILQQGVEGPSSLRQHHADFIAALPHTGDSKIDEYVRWYMSAGIFLTKGTAKGDVLTMGYAELNQRDSFWTTGVHLIFWPDLELKMLRESMKHQAPSGQVPVTILPVIDREYNIDADEYFILRIARYYNWYRDTAFLKEALPHVKSAIEFLVSQDKEKIGIPMQTTYWADWKDVSGVEGRTYAPHFDLLWLAALKDAESLAKNASDSQFATQLDGMYEKAYERINRDFANHGLWSGSRYVDLWEDGRSVPYTLEDQTVAAIFEVIPRDRLEGIYSTLNRSNESSFGVRETYPYIPAGAGDFGPGPGEYHDGGVWPWLNFADAWGRFLNGHGADAERIIKEVGYNGLERFQEFAPSEDLHGDTGRNRGFAIQGWDADLLSAIYFGAFGLERLSADKLAIHINLTRGLDFKTAIRVPEGDLIVSRTTDKLNIQKKLSRPLQIEITP